MSLLVHVYDDKCRFWYLIYIHVYLYNCKDNNSNFRKWQFRLTPTSLPMRSRYATLLYQHIHLPLLHGPLGFHHQYPHHWICLFKLHAFWAQNDRVFSGHLRSFQVISGHFRSSQVISGHLRSSSEVKNRLFGKCGYPYQTAKNDILRYSHGPKDHLSAPKRSKWVRAAPFGSFRPQVSRSSPPLAQPLPARNRPCSAKIDHFR